VLLAPIQRQVHWYDDPRYAQALGQATLYFDQFGNPIGLHDVYDFHPNYSGHRSDQREMETRAMGILGPLAGGKPFTVRYGWTPR